jgi:hypothetical protein
MGKLVIVVSRLEVGMWELGVERWSERQKVHQPPEDYRCANEASQKAGAEAQLFTGNVAHEYGEDDRNECGKDDEQTEMTRHHFRPSAMS